MSALARLALRAALLVGPLVGLLVITGALSAAHAQRPRVDMSRGVRAVPVKGAVVEVYGVSAQGVILLTGELLSVSKRGLVLLVNRDGAVDRCPTLVPMRDIRAVSTSVYAKVKDSLNVYAGALGLTVSTIANGLLLVITAPLAILSSSYFIYQMNTEGDISSSNPYSLLKYTRYPSGYDYRWFEACGVSESEDIDEINNSIDRAVVFLKPSTLDELDFRGRRASKKWALRLSGFARETFMDLYDVYAHNYFEYGLNISALLYLSRMFGLYGTLEWSAVDISGISYDFLYGEEKERYISVSPILYGLGVDVSMYASRSVDISLQLGLLRRSVKDYVDSAEVLLDLGVALHLPLLLNGQVIKLSAPQGSGRLESSLQLSWGIELF
jgi:hypothetical protein